MIDRFKSWLGAMMPGEARLDLEAEMKRLLSGGFAEFVLETVIGESIRKPGGYHHADAGARDVEKVMDSFRHMWAKEDKARREREAYSASRSSEAPKAKSKPEEKPRRPEQERAESPRNNPCPKQKTFSEGEMPRSKNDAYLVLNINAGTPESVAKRRVTELRRTWHPDLVSAEAERKRRTLKLQQINAAWKIVCGKR